MNPTQRKPGPAFLPKSLKRSWRLQVPLNRAERAAVTKAAGGRDLAVWARGVLLEAARDDLVKKE